MGLSDRLEAALLYAEFGFEIFPCAPGRKTPLTAHGHLEATTDLTKIERWWEFHPEANIGIATAGLLVLDVDDTRWLAGDPEKQASLAIAPLSLTANGGQQYFFRQPLGKSWRNTTGKLAPHVDTRADGGYVVVPPSVLSGERHYRWARGMELEVPPELLPEPPAWLVSLLDDEGPAVAPAVNGKANGIPSGQRNATLARLAGTMRRAGMSQAEITAAISQANDDRCQPPVSGHEVNRIASSVARYEPDQVTVAVVEDHWQQMQGKQAPLEFEAISSKELAETDYQLEYLIDGLLVRGQPGVIAGPKKTLKTNLSIDLALSLSEAGLFLGRFNVETAARVGVMSGESGAATIQETGQRIAVAKHQRLQDFNGVVWSFQIPQLGQVDHIDALRRFIADHELEVLILDPTYLMMMGLGNDAGNLFIVGSFLKSLGDLAHETGCTPLLCHHLKKSVSQPYEPAELENMAWAGFQEFMRQWILLNRRVKYDPDVGGHHELWMSVGGSAGHSGLWGINVDEGSRQDDGGRRWEVEVLTAAEAYDQRRTDQCQTTTDNKHLKRESQRDHQRRVVMRALMAYPAGETKRALSIFAGVSGDVINEVTDELLEESIIERCSIRKNTRNEEAYRLIKSGGATGATGATN